MRIREQLYSAHVELPCKIFCGPDSLLEIMGTAVKIGPANVYLRVGQRLSAWQPAIGEHLRVELLLPADSKNAGARYLSARATVAEVTEEANGTRWLELRFRKPAFKYRTNGGGGGRSATLAPVKWTM